MSKPKWSKDRPVKPSNDPLFLELVSHLKNDKRSNFAKANVSGLSPTTIKNWADGKVRHPQSVSMQMAARMLGLKLKFEKE